MQFSASRKHYDDNSSIFNGTTDEHCLHNVNAEILVGTIAIQSYIRPESSPEPSLHLVQPLYIALIRACATLSYIVACTW